MRIVLLNLSADAPAERLRSALVQERHSVDLVCERAVATWLAQEDGVSVVVVCVGLQDATIVDWLVQLRGREVWVPLVVVLDETDPGAVVALLDAGADDCVARPVRFSEIAARVRALGRRRAVARPAMLDVGDLRLDPADHRVWRAGDEIDLTPREFALLHALMRQPGRALTRESLLEAVWDRSLEPVSNVVDQYVARLRRLIDTPYDRADLQTVRGIGYRLRRA